MQHTGAPFGIIAYKYITFRVGCQDFFASGRLASHVLPRLQANASAAIGFAHRIHDKLSIAAQIHYIAFLELLGVVLT